MFPDIAACVGDPEHRCIATTATAGVLLGAVVVLSLVVGWSWRAIVAFTVSSVVGLVEGWLAMARALFVMDFSCTCARSLQVAHAFISAQPARTAIGLLAGRAVHPPRSPTPPAKSSWRVTS